MKILLVNPPIRENAPPVNIPIGLGTIASVLINEGHEVNILDINARRLSHAETLKSLDLNDKYDVIGIGGLITTYKFLKYLIPEIKKRNPRTKIILGGGIVTESPHLLMSQVPVDIAVIGEGEITIKEVIANIENNISLENVLGIAFKEKNNEIQLNPPRPLITNLDEIPFPAYDLFPIDIYLNNQHHSKILGKKKEINIITNRGCPFNCNYCYHIFSRGVRSRSIKNVIEEIKFLIRNYNVDALSVIDETFTLNKKRILEFCEALRNEKINISWSCYGRVNLIDPNILKIMKKAGCYRIGFGIESGSQKILDNMNKKVTVEQAEQAIRMVRNIGIICGTTFMFGYPGETKETIEETVRFCEKLLLTPSFFYTTPYPGTQLFKTVKNKIIQKYKNMENFLEVLEDASDFRINLTSFSDEELVKLKQKVEKNLRKIPFYKYHLYYYNYYKQLGFRRFTKRSLTKVINNM